MKFYRIENQHGGGPYRTIECETWETSSHNYGDRNPGPYTDFPMGEWANTPGYAKRECLFGFSTLAQLRKWFNKTERKRLRRLGYVIVRYEGEPFAVSDLQAAFVPGKKLRCVAK